jgi:hypothetical protein
VGPRKEEEYYKRSLITGSLIDIQNLIKMKPETATRVSNRDRRLVGGRRYTQILRVETGESEHYRKEVSTLIDEPSTQRSLGMNLDVTDVN